MKLNTVLYWWALRIAPSGMQKDCKASTSFTTISLTSWVNEIIWIHRTTWWKNVNIAFCPLLSFTIVRMICTPSPINILNSCPISQQSKSKLLQTINQRIAQIKRLWDFKIDNYNCRILKFLQKNITWEIFFQSNFFTTVLGNKKIRRALNNNPINCQAATRPCQLTNVQFIYSTLEFSSLSLQENEILFSASSRWRLYTGGSLGWNTLRQIIHPLALWIYKNT